MRIALKRLEALERESQPTPPPQHLGICLVPMGEAWGPQRAARWMNQLGESAPTGKDTLAREVSESPDQFRARAAAHFSTGLYFVS